MSIDPQILQAIYDLIFDSLTTAPAEMELQPAVQANSTMLSMNVPGLPINPAEFANPWTPMNPGGDPVTAENFAWLVDNLPGLSAIYMPNGNSLEALYGQIVLANIAAPAPSGQAAAPAEGRAAAASRRPAARSPSPEPGGAHRSLYTEASIPAPYGGSIKTFIETPAYSKYLDRRADRDAAVTRYMARRLQVDMKDAAERQRWATASADLAAQVESAVRAMSEAGAGEIEAAMAMAAPDQGTAQNDSVAAIFAAARLDFEASRLGSALGPGYSWHMTLAQPANWFTPAAPFCEVDLSTKRGLRINHESRFQRHGGQADSIAGLWGFHDQGALVHRSIEQGSVDIRVRFKFARIAIRRPWVNTSLFSLSGWSMAGRPRNALSSGSWAKNAGLFPLLPTSMILARDLRISATWSADHAAFIRERLDRGDLTFGPFTLSGRVSHPRGRITGAARSDFDGVNIDAPGLQVIGWLSELVPACPPLDG